MFFLGITFSTVLRTPLDLHFGVILATILPLGCPWRPLEPLLELSWASVGVLSLRCEVAKVCVLEHLGTARAPLYCFRGVLCAREASSWIPRAAPDALVGVPWRSLGALGAIFEFFGDLSMLALFLSYLGWGAMCDPYTPVHVL